MHLNLSIIHNSDTPNPFSVCMMTPPFLKSNHSDTNLGCQVSNFPQEKTEEIAKLLFYANIVQQH